MNNVILLGRITRDPELRHTEGGTPYCRFTLAVDRNNENTDFLPCICWGDTAENLVKYVQKGRQLLVQGKLQSGSYTDKDGNTRYTLDVFVYIIEYLARPKGQSIDGFRPVKDDDLPF